MISIVMPILLFTLVQGFLKQCFYETAIYIAFLIALFFCRCFAFDAYSPKCGRLLCDLQADEAQDDGHANKSQNYYRENMRDRVPVSPNCRVFLP